MKLSKNDHTNHVLVCARALHTNKSTTNSELCPNNNNDDDDDDTEKTTATKSNERNPTKQNSPKFMFARKAKSNASEE